MEYVYASLLLHSAKQKITEASVKKVLTAAGTKPDDAKIKALVAALEGVKIEDVIKQTAIPVATPVAPATKEAPAEKKEKAEESPEEEEKKAEEAASGLASLFG